MTLRFELNGLNCARWTEPARAGADRLAPHTPIFAAMQSSPARFSAVRAMRDLRGFLASARRTSLIFGFLSAMTTLLMAGFMSIRAIEKPWKRDIHYVESWPLDRTDEQIRAQQKIDVAKKTRLEAELKRQAGKADEELQEGRRAAERARALTGDARYMAAAIALSERGRGRTAPNPNVGCVIVEGRPGRRARLDPAGRAPACRGDGAGRGGRSRAARPSYVTLEPCAHQSRAAPPAPICWSRRASRAS